MALALVTGAAGFIGRALVAHLLRRGDRVIAVARRAGAPAANLTWHEQDFLDEPALPRALLRDVEHLYLLAALAHRPAPRDEAGLAALERLNVEHPATVARQAAAAGVQRLVFLSSIGAQSGSAGGRVTPGTPCRPATAYGESKRRAELALAAVAGESGLAVTVLRPPLVVGPGAPGNLARLAARAAAGKPLPSGTLRNRRSLVGLTGLVEALDLAARHPDAAGQTYLVAETPPLSAGALYRRLAEAAGREGRFLPLPGWLLGPLLRLAGRGAAADGLFGSLELEDPRLAALGWRPSLALGEEITRAVQLRRN